MSAGILAIASFWQAPVLPDAYPYVTHEVSPAKSGTTQAALTGEPQHITTGFCINRLCTCHFDDGRSNPIQTPTEPTEVAEVRTSHAMTLIINEWSGTLLRGQSSAWQLKGVPW